MKYDFLSSGLFSGLFLLQSTEWDAKNSHTFTCYNVPYPTVFVVVCEVTSYNKRRSSTCALTNRKLRH